MSNDPLKGLPIWRGSAIILGGEMSFTLAKRLAHFIRRAKPRLKTVISTPDKAIDHLAVNLIVPSWNRELNATWFDRSNLSGIITAKDECRFEYLDSVTGITTKHELPAVPAAVGDLLQQLGY